MDQNPYSQVELVDEREYQKVQMKPTMVHFKFFLGIKLFCLSRQKAEIFSISLIQDFVKPCKLSAHSDKHLDDIFVQVIKSCPNQLKFCGVSRNPKSNSCLNFQLSILTKILKCTIYHRQFFFQLPDVVIYLNSLLHTDRNNLADLQK